MRMLVLPEKRWKPDSSIRQNFKFRLTRNVGLIGKTIYDRLGNELWFSLDPKDSWSGMMYHVQAESIIYR